MEPVKNEAIANGEEYYLFDTNVFGRPHYPYCIKMLASPANRNGDQIIKGKIWKHVGNGKLYVKRSIKTLDESVVDEERSKYLDNVFESAIVFVDLSSGMIVPKIVGWDCLTKSEPSDWSKERIMKKIAFYNTKDSSGRFVNRWRDDQWMNFNLPIE